MIAAASSLLIPLMLTFVLGYSLVRRISVFDVFINGAEKGLASAFKIVPALVGLVCAVSMLRASGAIEFITALSAPVLRKIGFPAEVLPLALLKSVSGSGGLAVLKDIFSIHGPDSYPGTVASVMLGSSETTFYALAVYFGAVKITNTRYTLFGALIADLVGILASFFICRLFFGQ